VRRLDLALFEILNGRGTRYDPDVVDACLDLCEQDRLPLNHPNGPSKLEGIGVDVLEVRRTLIS